MIQGTDDRTDIQHRIKNLEPYKSTSDPGANNDSVDTAGIGRRFAVGSIWLNTVTPKAFHCFDNSTGAAIWA
jgi:hypothetical protein